MFDSVSSTWTSGSGLMQDFQTETKADNQFSMLKLQHSNLTCFSMAFICTTNY